MEDAITGFKVATEKKNNDLSAVISPLMDMSVRFIQEHGYSMEIYESDPNDTTGNDPLFLSITPYLKGEVAHISNREISATGNLTYKFSKDDKTKEVSIVGIVSTRNFSDFALVRENRNPKSVTEVDNSHNKEIHVVLNCFDDAALLMEQWQSVQKSETYAGMRKNIGGAAKAKKQSNPLKK